MPGWKMDAQSPRRNTPDRTSVTAQRRGTACVPVIDGNNIQGSVTVNINNIYRGDRSTGAAGQDGVGMKSADGTQKKDSSIKIPDLIYRLNLSHFYPSKLTTADAFNINRTSFQKEEPQSEKKPLKEKDLAFVYLHKLLTLDYRARSLTILNECVTSKTGKRSAENKDFYAFLNDECEYTDSEDGNTQIHPMDVQMAVFHCADSFLRQNMVTKLSSCQYALPLLVPSPTSADIELPLWTFRQIKKTWKSVGGLSTSLPVCQIKAPMVFFCRLGSVSTSKSQLLNSVINPKHDTFFHRDSPGSIKNHQFMEGLVEIAWYCPAGNTDDLFSECIAFCNLHGDAVKNRAQTDFLSEQATVNVVLMENIKNHNDKDREMVQKLHNLSKPLICLMSEQKGTNTMGSGDNIKYKIGLRDRNQAELHEELISVISTCLQKYNSAHTFSLEANRELAKSFGFRVDEDSQECQAGKTGALEVIKLLKREDISQIKAKFLPCQGKLWQEWSNKNKEQYRLYGDVEQTKSKIQEHMKSIRNQQRKTSLDLMKAVCKNLTSKHISKKMYFVRWLGVYLDVSFLEKLSEVTQQYYKQLADLQLLKQKRKITDDFRKKQEELIKLSEKVDAVTFGLEHIVREMAQIYEAWAECPDKMTAEVSTLPVVAADLLISGHPLELMDGDAAHVPLTWIQSVLDKVTERLGDQRVFVLSVLGLQSSGKSTMLNAMFGLQFAVSAGRCTRGAFMQLIRVKEEVKEQLNFDFLLVVDTEGLQSLQLVSKQSTLPHDNELATFVTGLADLTLINIFGENPAEMKDIIQIVVQAFLRMKKVKLTPSCMFVHQNVADISAGEKNMEGRSQLQKQLDEMTHLAATQEVCSAEYFTDVIKFNIQTDVHYFAQLWEGNPPMAPLNPRYSENIENLKQAILKAAAGKKCLKLSELKVRIKDLWTAVLNEDFVFSFKNTLEISVYRRLEVMYGNWTWELRENMLFIENKLHNWVENGKVVAIDQRLIHEEINSTFCAVKNKTEKFFTEDKDAEILSQWKSRTEQRIKVVHDSLIEAAARKINELLKLKKACKKLDEKKTQYENELFNRSKDLASTLKDKAMNELSLRREFDSMWGKWLSDLRAETPPIKDVNVEQEVMNILSSSFERRTIYFNRDSRHYKWIYNRRDYSDYVTVKKGMFGFSSHSLDTKDHDSIRKLVQQTVREAEEIIRTKPVDRTGYSDAYTQEIVNCVKKRVAEFKAEKFTLKNEFTVDLSLFVCDIAVRKFTDLHKVFREANDPVIYLGNKKGDFFSMFKKQCGGATATAVFADFVCNKLKSSILQSVYDQTAIDAAGEMRANFPAFSGNRSNLEKHILQDLAEAESFERFITYIKNPKIHFSDFIETKFKEQMLEGRNPRILEILRNAANMKQSSVSIAIQKATQETKYKKDVNEWLKRFSLELEGEVIFTVNDVEGAHYQEINDTDFFGQVMNKTLQSVFNETTSRFTHKTSVRMDMFRQSPEDILKHQLCGCWVQCPFCAAICTNTIEGHDGKHSVPFHRPEGVNGWKWYKTENLSVDTCTSSVVSDAQIVLPDEKRVPYRKYWEAGPEYACWSITPDASEQAYWKWFVCRFQKDLEKHYGKTFKGKGEIPTAWSNITKKNAIESLDN
ncbi:interferon-induced very large GTPase 1-like [Colossoma macropomum]|uniref:interferon-induced very large GTPase 1-like n=1 Tax=Colossoma macropomum TaxID=42526 RepID=UPI001863B64A|nr:interferon-induced very large GTPase 1-like [Colossoma macropomum]